MRRNWRLGSQWARMSGPSSPARLSESMETRRQVRFVGLLFLASFCLSGCRQLNPGFFNDPGPIPKATTADEDPLRGTQDTAQSTVTNKDEIATASKPTQTLETRPTQEDSPMTTLSSESPTMSLSLSSSSDSSTEIVPWPTDTPAPVANASDEDPCLRGSKACYVFADHSASQLESVTPGFPGMFLSISGGLAPPASGYASLKAPLDKGIRVGGDSTHIESTAPFPRYEGQDFGIEIWYRSDASTNYPEQPANQQTMKRVMLVQVPSNIWIDESPIDGGVSCGGWSSDSPWHRVQHPYKVGPTLSPPTPRDQLRVAACVIAAGKMQVFSNGVLNVEFKDPNRGVFRVHSHSVDQRIAVGGWVDGNDAATNFLTFQGTVYMVRLWNNIKYMKDAMIRDLNYHELGQYTTGVNQIVH